MFSEHPELLIGFGKNLFVVLVDMFTSTVNPSVRYKCLSAITKILYFETADMLSDLLEVLTPPHFYFIYFCNIYLLYLYITYLFQSFAFSSFVAGLLASRDNAVVAVALKMAEIMMEKLPSIFSRYTPLFSPFHPLILFTKPSPLVIC